MPSVRGAKPQETQLGPGGGGPSPGGEQPGPGTHGRDGANPVGTGPVTERRRAGDEGLNSVNDASQDRTRRPHARHAPDTDSRPAPPRYERSASSMRTRRYPPHSPFRAFDTRLTVVEEAPVRAWTST